MLQKCKPMRQTKCPAVTIVAVVITVQAFSKIFQRQYRICAICKEKKVWWNSYTPNSESNIRYWS